MYIIVAGLIRGTLRLFVVFSFDFPPFLLHFAFTICNAKTPKVFVTDIDVGTVVVQIALTTSRLASRVFRLYSLYSVYTCTLCTRDQSAKPLYCLAAAECCTVYRTSIG